jgi:HEAT repeat protein
VNESLRCAVALGRHGALTRPVFGKPRGTRTQAADRKEPVPGHYYPGTAAWFVVLDKPLDLEAYLWAMREISAEDMRMAAANVVAEFGDASCIGPLGAVLHNGTCEGTRRCAAHALASIGGPEAEEILWRALEHEKFPRRVREAAMLGLLDLLTPDGWENYTFMNPTRTQLSTNDHARLFRLRDDLPAVAEVLAMFDKPTAEDHV